MYSWFKHEKGFITSGPVLIFDMLLFLDPAEITKFSVNHNIIRENTVLSMTCDVTGNPDPVWSIRNNYTKEQLMSGNKAAAGWATTGPATCEDAGFWMCTCHNYLNYGKNSTLGENVTVLCTHYRFTSFLAIGDFGLSDLSDQ